MSDDGGMVFGIGTGTFFLGLLYMLSILICGVFHNHRRAKRAYAITIIACVFFTVFLVALPRKDENYDDFDEDLDFVYRGREFLIFFLTLFVALGFVLVLFQHWPVNIIATELSTKNPL